MARGRVIFRTSRSVKVQSSEANSTVYDCHFRGRLKRSRTSIVVGDFVEFELSHDGTGVIESVEPRQNKLSRRREVGGGSEVILAANLDQVIALFSAQQPRLKFSALDRVLVAADRQGLPARIVVNKIDLGLTQEIEARLAEYNSIGYEVHCISVEESIGIEALRRDLEGRATVVAGPSGVGKSSLLSRLLGIPIRVGAVSHANEKGRHTTTSVTWYPYGHGALIDTPGFRDYGLWGLDPTELGRSMPDLSQYTGLCHFRDCLHRQEPNCRVREAVEAGEIFKSRYQSYLYMLDSLEGSG